MANRSLLDLTELTTTADTDLLHVNSGGTDYKESKEKFVQDLAQRTTFVNTSSILDQVAALTGSNKQYYGILSSYGHQTETGVPYNANYYVNVHVNNSNSMMVELIIIGSSGRRFQAFRNSGTWSAWQELPSRSEVDTLNGSIARNIKTINSGESYTFTFANGSRVLIDIFGGATSRNAMYNVFVGSTGSMVWTAILSATNVSISSPGVNQLTITNTTTGTGNGLYINAIVFVGSIS